MERSGFVARVPLIMRRAMDRNIAEGGTGVNIGARVIADQTGLPYNTARRVVRGGTLSPTTMRVVLAVYGQDGEGVLDLFIFRGVDPAEPTE